jgi:hypothetical protein
MLLEYVVRKYLFCLRCIVEIRVMNAMLAADVESIAHTGGSGGGQRSACLTPLIAIDKQ